MFIIVILTGRVDLVPPICAPDAVVVGPWNSPGFSLACWSSLPSPGPGNGCGFYSLSSPTTMGVVGCDVKSVGTVPLNS